MNIIIGVTGGIAAYKSPILVRRLKERGAIIKVVMTHGASHFITPLTLQAVSGQPVRDSLLDTEAESGMDHIELARWADTIIIAPASANFIAKLANGFADDLLSTLCLTTTARIFVVPAMNQQMWKNRATQENTAKISQYGIHILGPEEGDQACGETGPGRMLDPAEIIEALFTESDHEADSSSGYTQPSADVNNPPDGYATALDTSRGDAQKGAVNQDPDKSTGTLYSSTGDSSTRQIYQGTGQNTLPRILITAGPTWEALDPVRGITNHSSGKMGYSIADAFSACGHETILISGPTALSPPANVTCINVISAQQMHDAVHEYITNSDIFISVAAVADYRPDSARASKIKKSQERMQINLVRNTDILKSVTALPKHPFTVGFAAETENVIAYAKSKLKKKNLDMIIANEVGDGKAFGQSTNQLTVISKNNEKSLGPDSKQNLARKLVTVITEAYENRHPD